MVNEAICRNCGSKNIENDRQRGDAVCTYCGVVHEENVIVSEITFAETAQGASSVIGQYVSGSGNKTAFPVLGGYTGFQKESREVTLGNGRRRIAQVAAALHLNQHCIESAQRLFALAVQNNFIQGRKTNNVIASCLYIVCRREKSPHLLIDFSDVLQTNLYTLGNTFLKFTRMLNIVLPLIDPSLYIHRFASKLEFNEKTHAVAMSALRLVQRMRRDWIQTGRRPSGICGAALLIAARIHGFRRTQSEIVQVVRVCNVTIRKRLVEFTETPSSLLTTIEFNTDLPDTGAECDPPAFTRNLKLAEERSGQAAADDLQQAMEEALGSEELNTIAADVERSLLAGDPLGAEACGFGTGATGVDTWQSGGIVGGNGMKIRRPWGLNTDTGEDQGEDGQEAFGDVDDTEIDNLLLAPEEVEMKTRIWNEMNKDFLLLQAERERHEEMGIRTKNKRKRASDRAATSSLSAAEAAADVLKKKKISSKINYSALKDLFEDEAGDVPSSAKEGDVPNSAAADADGLTQTATQRVPDGAVDPHDPSLTQEVVPNGADDDDDIEDGDDDEGDSDAEMRLLRERAGLRKGSDNYDDDDYDDDD